MHCYLVFNYILIRDQSFILMLLILVNNYLIQTTCSQLGQDLSLFHPTKKLPLLCRRMKFLVISNDLLVQYNKLYYIGETNSFVNFWKYRIV